MTFCNRFIQQPGVFTTNNNTYVNNFYNRQTNISNTFINQDNAGVSINSNVTVNNYNYGRKTGFAPLRQTCPSKIGQFLGGYRKPVQTGCGCKQPIQYGLGSKLGWGQRFGQYFHQPVQRFCTGITNTLRGFMNARFGNV